MRIPVPLVGQAYKHRSLELSAQTLKNWYLEVNPSAKDAATLQPWPGYKHFLTGSGAVDGGMHLFQNELYKITDSNLFRVDIDGNTHGIGEVLGEGKASIVSNAHEMIVVRSGNVYLYNGTDFSVVTDADLESPEFVAYLNNRAIYTGADQRFSVSNAGELSVINGLNFATAEASGDDLVSVYVHQEYLLLVGTEIIEPWYDAGSGNPPHNRVLNSLIRRGSLSGHSFASNQNYTYFLGDDYSIYRLNGLQIENVSSIPMAQQIATYESVNSAIGQCLTWDAQQFYVINFPGEATWCFNESSGSWFELTLGTDQEPYPVTSFVDAYGKKLISSGPSIFELDYDSFDNAGQAIVRERVSTPVTAAVFGPQYEGLLMQWYKLELIIKTLAQPGGQGSKPVIMLSFSDNHGRTWSEERRLQAAPTGRYVWRINTTQLGQSYERIFRVRISDPVHCSILGCTADVELNIG